MELIKREKTRQWLIDELQKRTNAYVDGSILQKVLTGKVKSERIIAAIDDVLGIEYKEQE